MLGIGGVNVKLAYSTNKKFIGFIDLLKVLKGDNTIKVNKNASPEFIVKAIAHEITHIKQIHKNELNVTEGNAPAFIWKGKEIISYKGYNKLIKLAKVKEYRSLPWEKEAFDNEKNFPIKFFNSKEYKDLADVNDTLKFWIDN